LLKRLKQALGVGDAVAGIANADHHPLTFHGRADGQFFARLLLHGTQAVFGKVQEHLKKVMVICPYAG